MYNELIKVQILQQSKFDNSHSDLNPLAVCGNKKIAHIP